MSASAYSVSGIPTTAIAGVSYPVFITLTGGTAPTGGFIATGVNAEGMTWGAPVSIASGSDYALTSITFTAPGNYQPTIAHTGTGISADPTLPAVTVVNFEVGVTTPTSGTVLASPAPSVSGFSGVGPGLIAPSGGYAGRMLRFRTWPNDTVAAVVATHTVSGSAHAFTLATNLPATPLPGDVFDL